MAHLRLPAQRRGVRGHRRRQHGVTVDASILGSVTPVERFSTSMVIGKKPGSTDPSDSFSGWIDEINISAG